MSKWLYRFEDSDEEYAWEGEWDWTLFAHVHGIARDDRTRAKVWRSE